MRKSEIKVGRHYLARVNGKLVTVRVDAIREVETAHRGGRSFDCRPAYDVTNLATGRRTTFRSAQKFRGPADLKRDRKAAIDSACEPDDPNVPRDVKAMYRNDAARTFDEEVAEAKQRPDPTTLSSARATSAQTAEASATTQDGVPSAKTSPTSPLASLLQRSIDAVNADSGDRAPHLIVEARAGTGKTTTLVEGLKHVLGGCSTLTPSPQQRAVWESMALSAGYAKTVCFVAFNKAIAVELQRRVPKGCDAMTMHSLGFKAVQKALGRQEPNQWVVQDIIAELLGRDIRELRRDPKMVTVIKATEELVSLCKMNLKDGTPEELSELASHYDVDLNGSADKVFDLVPRVLERCKQPRGRINFDDMIWLPVVLDLPMFRYDMLLVDEAQDLNRCQQALAKRAGRRLILCGDPKQAIYGFAGADAESMPRMARELDNQQHTPWGTTTQPQERGCVTLPLTVTRRCGKAIVEEARQIVPDFEAFETNPEGKIGRASYKPTLTPLVKPFTINQHAAEGDRRATEAEVGIGYDQLAQDGDMVLCRVNAPLVSQCFRFLKAGRKANIQGRDVGQGLISTVKKLCGKQEPISVSAVDLTAKLDDWGHAEVAKEQAKRNPSEQRIIAIQDRVDCLHCFAEGAGTAADVVAKIESVFTDDKSSPGIKLSSIHRAKGLEARRVFLLEPEGATVPHPMARSAWAREQEMNLRYVAITRAIEELVYVN